MGSTICAWASPLEPLSQGKVVVDGMDLPEGAVVTVLTQEAEHEVRLTAEEEAELLEAIAEVDRGETISAEELFARLDRIAKL